MKILSAIILIAIVLVGCNKESSSETDLAPLKISFNLQAFGAPIDTTVQYTNNSGEKFKISTFKFYVSMIEAVNSSNNIRATETESYHLVDLSDPATHQFTVSLKNGIYDKLNFIIGVDSVRNVSGAQTGALDPIHGMFWTWNTGYIFAKLEGKSPSSTAPFQMFTYHIGGFKTGENAIRTISLPAQIQIGKTNELVINTDVERWFDGVKTISIASKASIMSPGGPALQMADNYATMFSVYKVVNP
ncbi:MAG TPA: MbnP family protein [Chitinophagaceae bacterium]|nr:MbnP family protein [Chitinophagaceae bacterium]